MSNHTASPWKVVPIPGSYKQPFQVRDAHDNLVAMCIGDQLEPKGISIGAASKNARLIAAAPDLLEAVRELLLPYNRILGTGAYPAEDPALRQQCIDACESAKAALAKAEGR